MIYFILYIIHFKWFIAENWGTKYTTIGTSYSSWCSDLSKSILWLISGGTLEATAIFLDLFYIPYINHICTIISALQAATLIEAYLFQIEAAVIQGD